ncbi:MAG TPA: helix-turn-helix domain-containing protein [Acidimicrobiia bacterium]|nr:helix-turn-helix domain-containing protein [Acidimicrobiia bacterium]
MQSTEPEGLFSPRQLSAYLNMSVATIYDWRQRKCGPHGFRVGKHLRYRKSDVDRWTDEQIRATSRVSQ